jgi:hypothetical protein
MQIMGNKIQIQKRLFIGRPPLFVMDIRIDLGNVTVSADHTKKAPPVSPHNWKLWGETATGLQWFFNRRFPRRDFQSAVLCEM